MKLPSPSPAWHDKRMLVTGAGGIAGPGIIAELLRRGANVRATLHTPNERLQREFPGVDWRAGDLCNTAFCEDVLADRESVFHLAAFRRNVQVHEQQAATVLLEHVRLNTALLRALPTPAPMVVVFSSAHVKPGMDVFALAASDHPDGYILGKALSDVLWQTAAREHSFPLLIVRPAALYGPGDTFSEDGNVVPSLMVRASHSRDRLHVWGSGKQQRSFLFVDDLAPALFRLLDAGARGVEYIVPPTLTSIREIAERIRDLVQPDLVLAFDTSKPEGDFRMELPPLHPLFTAFPWTTIAEGLRRTHDWWRSNA